MQDNLLQMLNIKPCEPQQIHVALLYGGKSSEREISIKSAESVAQGLNDCGFEVIQIDTGEPHYIDRLEHLNPDIVFNCLHGKGGEDGCVQGVCCELGLPFTGSGVLASALSMDKAKSKVFYRAYGINTPASININKSETITYEQAAAKLGSKMVLKPANEGSAFGVSIVENKAEFDEALQLAESLDSLVLIEQFVAGTEITVAVMGNTEPIAMPVIEIVPHAEFYDFEAKYKDGGSDHICPAPLSEELTNKSQEMSIEAHKVLGCKGVSRSDLIIDENNQIWMLETNSIPGMTKTSLIPDSARAMGIDFSELCKLIVELGLAVE